MATTNTKTVNTTGVTYNSTTNVAQNWIEVAPAGANIFAIQDNTLSASIKVLGTGDTIYIEGNFADYQFKQNAKTITLDNGIARVAVTLSSMTNKVQVSTTLVFLDGSVTLTNKAGGTRVSINGFDDNDNARSQVLTANYKAVVINADDSNTTAATYFSTTEAAALVDQQNQVLFTAALEIYKAAHAETQVARAAAIEADNQYDLLAAAVTDAQSASVAEAQAGISIEASLRFEAAAAKEVAVATELTRLAGLTTSTVDNEIAVVATNQANAAVEESALATEYAIENEAAAAEVVAGYADLPTNFALTVNPDTFVGSTGDDYFNGSTINTLSTFDNLDGGAGTNSLIANISGTTLPAGLTIKNIQTATLQTSGAGLTADVSTWTGLTSATIVAATAGAAVLTAAATTDVITSFIGDTGTQANTIDGGKNISVTAVSIASSDTINVGGTTAASGNITINAALAASATAGTITARTSGGTSISVTETGGTTHGVINATDGAAAATVAGTLSTVSIDGATSSTITSNALTSLSIANAVTGGTVTVTNSLTSAIAAHTSALALTLTKVASTTLVDTNAEIGTLNITLGGTANTTGSTAQDSTLAAITDANLSALTVTGAATNKLTLSAATGLAGLKTLSVGGAMSFTAAVDLSAVATGLTGVTITTTGTTTLGATTVTKGIALATTYTGGAGNDVLTVGATTAAVNLGAGTNKLYMLSGTTALGAGGSIAGGTGTADTLVLTAADSTTLSTAGSAQTAFKAAVTGFEVLSVEAHAAATAVNATGFGTFNSIKLAGAASVDITTVSNLASGGTITITGANTGATTTTAGTTGSGADDTINFVLSQGTAGAVSFGTINTINVENVTFNMVDTQTTPVGYLNTAAIGDAALRTLVVTGNSGLNIGTLTGATALTSINASGVTGAGGFAVVTAANQYASTIVGSSGTGSDTLNAAAALAAVTMSTDATGTNSLTGSSTIASTITTGGGIDSVFGGIGADTISVGAGADVTYSNNAGTHGVNTIAFSATSAAAVVTTINGTAVSFTATTSATTTGDAFVTAFNATNLATLGTAVNASGTVTVSWLSDGANTVVATTSTGATQGLTVTTIGTSSTTGADVITGGAGSDNFVFGISSAAPSATALQTITDFNTGGVADFVMYSPTAVALAGTTTAASGVAGISAAGIATFLTADSATLALQLTAITAAITSGTTAQGESVAFQFGSNAYMFISDATNGVSAGDVLIQLSGINTLSTATDTLVASGHTLTLG
jgi:S-layer protein